MNSSFSEMREKDKYRGDQQYLAQSIKQCSKDNSNYHRPMSTSDGLYHDYPEYNQSSKDFYSIPSKFIPSFIEKNQNVKYNIIEVNNAVSFAGIYKCKDGLFCFADERSTRNNKLDNEHPIVQKIFENEYVILTAVGANEVNLYGKHQPIEEEISKLIEVENCSLKYFILNFQQYLEEVQARENISFIAYSKADNTINAFHFENCKYIFEGEDFGYRSGVEWAKSIFKNTFEVNYSCETTTIKDFEEYFKNKLIPLIKFMEEKGMYSSVSPSFKIIEYVNGKSIQKYFN